MAAPSAQPLVAPIPGTARASAATGVIDWIADPRRRVAIVAAGVAAIAAAAIVVMLVFVRGNPAAVPGDAYVTRLTHVRTGTAVASSQVLGDLHRGDRVTGVWVTAADGQTRWLKISLGGQGDGYVWGRNLSTIIPPALARTLSGQMTVTAATAVFAEPDQTATQIAVLEPGGKAQLVGQTANGWYELALDQGGVGYIAGSSPVQVGAAAMRGAGASAA